MTGILPSNLARFESGTRIPTLVVLEKCAAALGKHIELRINDEEWSHRGTSFSQVIINNNVNKNNKSITQEREGVRLITRKKRIWYLGVVYHVMERGIRRKKIYKDDIDYQVFMDMIY